MAGAAGFLAMIAAGAYVATSNDDPGSITVLYELTVVTDDYCYDFTDSGYDDIPNAEAEIFDGSGKLLGFGRLDAGRDTDDSCVFEAEFEIQVSSDGVYRATAGNENRGYVNFTDKDVVDGELAVSSIIE